MADKITLESLDARLEKADGRLNRIDARLDRIESDVGTLKSDVGTLKSDVGTLKSDVGTLKSDVGTLKSDVGTMKGQLTEHSVALNRLERDMSDAVHQLEDFNLQQKSLVSAITEALTQLHLSRSYEKRIDRLETAVFGKPG